MAGQQRLDLPDKVYFRIGEVARALDLKPHVVRFWQKEFPSIRPERSRTGRFLYTRATVEHIALIRSLLHERGYTIQGARKALREPGRPAVAALKQAPPAPAETEDRAEAAAETERLRAALTEAEAKADALARRLVASEASYQQLRQVVQREGQHMRTLLIPSDA